MKKAKIKVMSNKQFKATKREYEKKPLLELAYNLSDISERLGCSRFNGSKLKTDFQNNLNITRNFDLMRAIVLNTLTEKLRNLIYALGGVESREEEE